MNFLQAIGYSPVHPLEGDTDAEEPSNREVKKLRSEIDILKTQMIKLEIQLKFQHQIMLRNATQAPKIFTSFQHTDSELLKDLMLKTSPFYSDTISDETCEEDITTLEALNLKPSKSWLENPVASY